MRMKIVSMLASAVLVAAQVGGPLSAAEEETGKNLSVPAIFVPSTTGAPPLYNTTGLAVAPSTVPANATTYFAAPLAPAPAGDYYVQGEDRWQASWTVDADGLPVTAEWGDNLVSAPLNPGTPIRVEVGLLDPDAAAKGMTGFDVYKLTDELDRYATYGTLGVAETPYEEVRVWDAGARLKIQRSDGMLVIDGPFSAEINSTGRIVYGYNWQQSQAGIYTITFTAPTVMITAADAGTIPDIHTATLTVNVGNVPDSLSIANVSLPEGNSGTSAATFTVTRTGSLTATTTVQYATADGSAKAGSDYTATSGTLTFAANEASKPIVVPILGDTLFEPDETFTVGLSNPTNATLATAQAVGTIQNDDLPALSPPGLSIANVSLPEGDSGTRAATFTVTRTGSLTATTTVQYATADGAAKAGSDYTATNGTLTFAANEASKPIVVPILGDTLFEPDETFTVGLSNPTNATLGTAQAVGTIQNDDVQAACTPRPRVTQTLAAGGGALNVHVESTPLNTPANNPLRQIKFGTFQNAIVTMNGQAVRSGQVVTLPANTFAADLVVKRGTPSLPTTVPFTVVDSCGEWNTFVGGGSAAGF